MSCEIMEMIQSRVISFEIILFISFYTLTYEETPGDGVTGVEKEIRRIVHALPQAHAKSNRVRVRAAHTNEFHYVHHPH